MNDQEILRRDKIIYRYELNKSYNDSQVSSYASHYDYWELLIDIVCRACADFDVELKLIPAQEPEDIAPQKKGKFNWFIANIGGAVSPKFFLAKAAIFVALSNFLETKQ